MGLRRQNLKIGRKKVNISKRSSVNEKTVSAVYLNSVTMKRPQ